MPLIKGKMIAQADIHDWYEATLRSEIEIKNQDDMFKLVDAGMQTGDIVRHSIVNQELSAKPDLLGPNKLLLYSGGRAALAEKIRGKREVVQVNGHAYNLPSYIGPVNSESDGGEPADESCAATLALDMPGMPEVETNEDAEGATTYVPRMSGQAVHAVQAYLSRVVPGHIEKRLVILREHGLDVRGAADDLKREIDIMVNKLV